MTRAILFDRDGTLIVDAPPNTDAANVRPMPTAREAIRRAREAHLAVGVISNQPLVGDDPAAFRAMSQVNERIEELVGEVDGWFICPHADESPCTCRKPRPGLIFQAAAHLGLAPSECVVIGDIGSDVEAARACGARAILVPTPVTRIGEIDAAPVVARDLVEAVQMTLLWHDG
ncbi:MAG TPA: HAD-IIIA family hydrolase [Candidatus Acidoferrales bacterium]|nr:HAD-IIIA family hydrolase [Candidatus Acidoferrales bacterium]